MYMPVSSREEVTERSSLWLDFLGVGLRGRQRQGKGWGRLLPDRERQDRGSDDPLHRGAKIALESFGRRAHLSEARRTSENSVTAKFAECLLPRNPVPGRWLNILRAARGPRTSSLAEVEYPRVPRWARTNLM